MSLAPLLLPLTMQEWHGYRKGFIQQKEKEKKSPHTLQDAGKRCLSDNQRKRGSEGGFRCYASSLFFSGSGAGGEDGCLQKVSHPSCPSAIWPWQKREFHKSGWSSAEYLARCCCAAVCPLPPIPNIQYFLISEKQVGSWAAAELPPGALCCQRAS